MEAASNKKPDDSKNWNDEPRHTAVTIDHVTLLVGNLEATAQYYEKVFGIHVDRKDPRVYYIRVGNSFLGLIEAGNRTPGIDHFCFGIKDYDADQFAQKLGKLGLAADDHAKQTLRDPDGIKVQFGPTNYARLALAREN